ncbi:SOS response-associated peptidase [Halomonas sp. YLGW01]|uniref:SOS response-associated peptidase n=1 Tax=Halomonas sp. YLGW01 TaxID=2773308 RepID=UPI0017869E00|nr:SOS response-associated peptidase [Halomonas sp. YLGW01]
MCGRYSLYDYPRLSQAIRLIPGLAGPEPHAPRYNVAPGTWILGIRRPEPDGAPMIDDLWWGYRPAWAGPDAPQPINARVETLATSRYFKGAFRHHRCLIPADGWYEWLPQAGGKQPYYLCREDRATLFLAGIWGAFADGTAGCAIVTEPARGNAREIHDRMPLLLNDDSLRTWLDSTLQERDAIRSAVHHLDADTLTHWPVSTRINRPTHDDPRLIEPESDKH